MSSDAADTDTRHPRPRSNHERRTKKRRQHTRSSRQPTPGYRSSGPARHARSAASARARPPRPRPPEVVPVLQPISLPTGSRSDDPGRAHDRRSDVVQEPTLLRSFVPETRTISFARPESLSSNASAYEATSPVYSPTSSLSASPSRVENRSRRSSWNFWGSRSAPYDSPDEIDSSPSPDYRAPRSTYRNYSVRETELADDVVEEDSYNQFSIAFLNGSVDDSAGGDLTELDALSDDPTVSTEDTVATRSSEGVRCYSSVYTGFAESGGDHSATLKVIHESQNHQKPLFRWLHVQQDVMNFDEFWSRIAAQPGFSDAEKKALPRLRANIKKHAIRTRVNPRGAKTGFMTPGCVRAPLANSDEKQSTPDPSQPSNVISWICLPYFTVQRYSGLLAAANQALFPAQTLMQAQYSRTNQQRDMEQAICKLGDAPDGQCFHIAQVWCLIMQNHMMTCGSMGQSSLGDGAIQINTEPSRGLATEKLPGRIVVSYGEAFKWLFTAEECSTWFDFISKFHEFWPQTLEFKHRNNVLGPSTWPKLVRIARVSRAPCEVSLSMATQVDSSNSAKLNPGTSDPARDEQKEKPAPDTVGSDLHIFTLDVMEESPLDEKNEALTKLRLLLAKAENFVVQECSSTDVKFFKTCGGETRARVYAVLQELEVGIEGRDDLDGSRRRYQEAFDMYTHADVVFSLFFPRDFDAPTTDKYWGAIRGLMGDFRHDTENVNASPAKSVSELRRFLTDLSRRITTFQRIAKYASSEQRRRIRAPRQIITAWLHIVSALVGPSNWWGHMGLATSLLSEGLGLMVKELGDAELITRTAVMPADIAALAAINLLGGQIGDSEDITEIYYQYLSSLESDITNKPSDRSYKRMIDMVQQEMSVIRNALWSQQSIVQMWADQSVSHMRQDRYETHDFARSVRPAYSKTVTFNEGPLEGPEFSTKLPPTSKGGLRSLFLSDCLRVIEQREFEFRRYRDLAEDIDKAVANKVDWTKDRQESAIYAFTLVTIIFLPLSAVSSIFGMNTSDIRDMEPSQWLYWSVALPVTISVIIFGLWWMNELDSVWSWITRKPSAWSGEMSGPKQRTGIRYSRERFSRKQTLMPESDASEDEYRISRRRSRRARTWRDSRTPSVDMGRNSRPHYFIREGHRSSARRR